MSTLSLRCSLKGTAGAVEKRNRYGDFGGLGDRGAQVVLARLAAPPMRGTVRVLDLAWNHLGDGSMMALRDAWPVGLQRLCLDWNNIGEEGAVFLAAALVRPAAEGLAALDMRSNPLGDRGAVSLCKAVSKHPSLQWLGLGETSLTDEGAVAAMQSLVRHAALKGLDLGENALTDASCLAVAEVIASTPLLEKLLLRGYLFEPKRITDAGGVLLARAVAGRRTGVKAPWQDGGGGSHGQSLPRPFELEMDYQQVGCKTAGEMSRCCGEWSRFSAFNTEVSTMGATMLANAHRDRKGSAAATRLNLAQCRLGAGAVELLRRAGFQRLDSHGQRAPPGGVAAAAVPKLLVGGNRQQRLPD